jgi:TfoX/Sxy family transcriptional regulator of competence genes
VGVVAYDEALAKRVRALLAEEADVAEQRMFGGLAFLVQGNMAVAASGQGGMLVRVDQADTDELCSLPGVRRMEMRGRPMRGWLVVDSTAVDTTEALERWVRRGATYARSLPATSR